MTFQKKKREKKLQRLICDRLTGYYGIVYACIVKVNMVLLWFSVANKNCLLEEFLLRCFSEELFNIFHFS